MSKFLLLLLCSLNIFVGRADDLLQSNLISTCSTGNPRNIADFCLNHVRKELRKGKIDDARMDALLEDKDLRLTCWMGRYFASLKWKGTFVASEFKDPEFTRWLLSKPEIFEKLLFANRPNAQTLGIFYRIRAKENGQLPPPLLHLALGAALCADQFTPDECVARFDFYKNSFEKKALFPQFNTLEPWEAVLLLRETESVLGGLENLAWGQAHVDSKKNITPNNIAARACGFTPYRDKNKEGISIHRGNAFYDNKPTTLKLYTEYGGVCGAVSKAACGYLKSKGIPCYTIGQPGHCAFVWKKPDGTWAIGNNIHGWNQSSGNASPWSGPSPLIRLVSQFTGEQSTRSNLCLYLANYIDNKNLAPLFLRRAIKENPNNYPAWKLVLPLLSAQTDEAGKKEIALTIGEQVKDAYIVHDLIYTSIPFNWKQTDPYDICSLLLDEEETHDSRFIYTKQFRSLALKEITDLNKFYSEKGKTDFFESWKNCGTSKPSLKTKRQTCSVLQKAMGSIAGKEKIYGQFLELYSQFLLEWKDKALMAEADPFIRSQLKIDQKPTIRAGLIKLGMQLAESTGNKKASQFYVEASSDTAKPE